jgi:hypothetical protein
VMRETKGCSRTESRVFTAPAVATDVGASLEFSRGEGGDTSSESAAPAASSATLSGVTDASVSDEFPCWAEGWRSMESTVWAASSVEVCVDTSAELFRGEDNCASRERTVCAVVSGVVGGGTVGEDSAGGLGSLDCDELMGGRGGE